MKYIKKALNEDASFHGRYTITIADASSLEAKFHLKLIEMFRLVGLPYMDMVRKFNQKFKVGVQIIENVVCTVGKAAIMDHLTNASPSPTTLRVNYIALGSNTTTPVAADTQLGTETYRNTTASATKSNNIGYITGFFTAVETSGTYRECGLFINGTASANTGTLLSHASINVVKTALQTLTIDFELTLT